MRAYLIDLSSYGCLSAAFLTLLRNDDLSFFRVRPGRRGKRLSIPTQLLSKVEIAEADSHFSRTQGKHRLRSAVKMPSKELNHEEGHSIRKCEPIGLENDNLAGVFRESSVTVKHIWTRSRVM
jgi:hypothetical protein